MKALGLHTTVLALAAALALACGSNNPAADESPTDPHEAAYAALVPRRGTGARIVEHRPYRGAEWRFFQLQDDSSGRPVISARAAVDGKGHAVAPRLLGDSAWNAFLTQEGLDPRTAQSRIAWLFLAGVVVVTGDGAEVDDPRARAMVTDPSLERTAGGVKFVGWFARPPDFDPWRTTIEAPAAGTASVLEEMWHELPGAR